MRTLQTSIESGRSVARAAARAGSNIGLSLLGAGLLALAAVEAGLLVQRESHLPPSRLESAPAAASLHSRMGASSATLDAPLDPSAAPLLATHPSALATQESSVRVIGITAAVQNTGTSLYRLLSNGRIEVSVLHQGAPWSEWTHVAPGLSGNIAPKKDE